MTSPVDTQPPPGDQEGPAGLFGPMRASQGVMLVAGLTLLGAAAVLTGWALDIRVLKSISPSYVTMKANTAVGLMLLALGLLGARLHGGRAIVRVCGLVCSLLAGVIASLTLAEYLLGVDLGIDELLFVDLDGRGGRFPPGRFAPITALSFLLLAGGDLLLATRRRAALLVAQALALVVFLAAFQAVVGYASGVTYNFGSAFYTQIALHTAFLLALLCAGQLLLHPEAGFMTVLGAPTEGGRTARRLIASAILVPPLVNVLQLQGQRLGLYDADFGGLLRILGNSLFFTLLVWRNAVALHRADLRRQELLAAEQQARRHAEALAQQLRESEAQLRILADSIPQLVWIAEADGAIRWYNQRWYEYTGTTREEMEREDAWRQVPASEVPRVEARFKAAIASGELWEDTFPLRRRDGTFRWHLSRAVPVRDATGRIVRWFGTNTDVEAQRQQAAELRDALQARETFLQVAAHELRTPLTSLQLRLQQARRDVEVTPAQALHVPLMRNLVSGEAQVRKLAGLINGLLDVSRLTTSPMQLEVESVDLASLVREVASRFGSEAERIGCGLDVSASGPIVGPWDRLRLEQVVTSLLSNALKYGPGHPIHLTVELHEGRARLVVRDQGIGIAAEHLERIFEKFARATSERHYGGLGLGLYVTRRIIETMKGTVTVESAPGQGAAFTVELPLASAAAP